jgi:hypothetical protein
VRNPPATSAILLAALALTALHACSKEDDAVVDAGTDGGQDALKGVPCNNMCTGTCNGLCVGICSERSTNGDCMAQCVGTCIGGCEGSCARPDAGSDLKTDKPPAVDAGRDARDARDAGGDAGVEAASPGGGEDAEVSDGGDPADVPWGTPPPAPSFGTWVDRTRASTASWPPLSQTGAMVYDDWRLKVVMFGGFGDRSNNVWEWDTKAGTWTLMQQMGGPRPSPRVGHALAFDSGRGKLILYGGIDATGASNGETWEWDGDTQTWTKKGPGPVPSRWGHAMVFDESAGQIVMFGGAHRDPQLGDGELLDTWQYDPATDQWTNWTYPLPGIWPRARTGHAMAFDPSRGVVVMYGGNVVNLGAAGDLWEWASDLHAWRERTPVPLPAIWPLGRNFASINYIGGGQMLLFDDEAPAFLRWNGTTNLWQSLTPPAPAVFPPARMQPISAWDRAIRSLIVVGAPVAFGKETRTDTWQWSP